MRKVALVAAFGLLFAAIVAVYAVGPAPCIAGAGGCSADGPTIEQVVGGVLDIPGAVVGALFSVLGKMVDALMAVVNVLIDQLPDMPDLGIPDLSGLVRGYAFFNHFLPLDVAIGGILVYLAAANAGFLFRVGVTIYHLIPKPGMGT